MENLMMNLIDKTLNIQEEEKEAWKVTDDLKADWCLDKIREARAEYNRFEMVAKAKIEQIEAALKTQKNKMESEVSFFESKLREYFETIDNIKATKTQATYSLPSGKLVLKQRGPEFVKDDDKLVEWLEGNKLNEFVKVKKSGDWANIKKNIEVVGSKVVSKATGEIVEGVTVVERDPEFKVEV